jgi:hypothetical protein
MKGDSLGKSARTHRPSMERIPGTFAPKLVPLPGEFLQVQMKG